MPQLKTLQDVAAVIGEFLKDKPKGTVAKMPSGDLAWIEDGYLVGCWPNDGVSHAYQWDESAIDSTLQEEVTAWAANPIFDHILALEAN